MCKGLTLVFIITLFQVKSQSLTPSVVATSGAFMQMSVGSVEWTLGELAIETYAQSNHILTQGFHQPKDSEITGDINEINGLSVYPNPVGDYLFLEAADAGNYSVELFNLFGQCVHASYAVIAPESNPKKIEIQNIPQAVYLLRITNSSTGKKTLIKIIKS